ncbi:dienelactone hydrolase family protein [Kutzneria albida]|uniref:Uncharacterized protein n=1 Tax=Kutzneria albida DSM 43870 TaxID=1449976 RepID=W5WRS1_9PSEU|nr:dienelactone hydrolase family protein [Kutzneria albida]AHI00875.1 hypothetical protein KALB_7517 [Kutzneria albida DSM 43870]
MTPWIPDASPPFLFQLGNLDHIVPFGQSAELRAALGAGEPHGYPLADHEFLARGR